MNNKKCLSQELTGISDEKNLALKVRRKSALRKSIVKKIINMESDD